MQALSKSYIYGYSKNREKRIKGSKINFPNLNRHYILDKGLLYFDHSDESKTRLVNQ